VKREIVVTWLNASFEMRFRFIGVIDASHFTWEDAAAEYAALVTDWWRGAAKGSRK
jgi:pimeloyl-ACP methyl ester carboxylesterase